MTALRLLRGHATPTPSSLLSATIAVAAAEAAHDDAVWALLDADTRAERRLARVLVEAAHWRLMAAVARRARLEADSEGKRWLEVVRG